MSILQYTEKKNFEASKKFLNLSGAKFTYNNDTLKIFVTRY
jgi:hypothetical protein